MARTLALGRKSQVVTCGFAAALVVAAAATAAGASGWGGATAKSSAAAPSTAALLARRVPILVLHPAERFAPVRADGFIADSDLEQRTATGWQTIGGPPPSGGGDLRLDQRACRAIDGVAASPCYAASEDGHGSPPVVYGAAFRRGKRIALQYWLWYPWNVYSPTVPPGDIWQVHEGDWESISVLLDAKGTPLQVGLSSHCAGTRRDWSRAPKRGPRPLVHVALGSHANFFRTGAHRLSPACWTPQLIAIIEAYGARPVDSTANGRVVRPRLVRVTASAPAWMRFAGAWGEDGYVRFPGNDPIVYGLGPRGPAFHEQWRKPVAELLSWPSG